MKKTFSIYLILSSAILFAQPSVEVAEQIIKQAESKYPNNYFMQKHYIESEMKSLLDIHKIKEELKRYNVEAEKEKNNR